MQLNPLFVLMDALQTRPLGCSHRLIQPALDNTIDSLGTCEFAPPVPSPHPQRAATCGPQTLHAATNTSISALTSPAPRQGRAAPRAERWPLREAAVRHVTAGSPRAGNGWRGAAPSGGRRPPLAEHRGRALAPDTLEYS